MRDLLKPISYLVLFVLLSNHCLQAQSNTITTGGDAQGMGGSVSFSVGEIAYSTYTSGGLVIQGVQQPYTAIELPITLVHFKATVISTKQVQLNWATASELNNQYFIVERSSNGTEFRKIGSALNSKGNSVSTQQYQTWDYTPLQGVSYYRLRQTDIDGKTTYSNTVKVSINNLEEGQLNVYPNPTTTVLTLQLPEAATHKFYLSIYSEGGKLVKSQPITTNQTVIYTASLANGVYLLEVIENGKPVKSFRVIKN